MNFETVIGIEIHCELKTKTKMFSGSKRSFADEVNTNVNEVDLGMPGTLPTINKRAVQQALKACHIFGMEVYPRLVFDRKCYFYPDLTKGYQITQNDFPIGRNGKITIDVDGNKKEIVIAKLVMEEDTAQLKHFEDYSLIDYNRAGNPLIEIISDASIRSAKEASTYVSMLRNMLVYADVSDAKMEEGSMRCDINVSLRPYGQEAFGTKTEIKNLNSISNIEKAINYEVGRQAKLLLAGESISSETRRFDEATKTTVKMRGKDGIIDYRFHREPNLLPTRIPNELLESVKDEIPLMPEELLNKYVNEYGLSVVDANILINDKEVSDYYNQAVQSYDNYKGISNWIISELFTHLNKNNVSINQQYLSPQALAKMIKLTDDGEISSKQVKRIFEIVNEDKHDDIDKIIKENNMAMISDEGQINAIIDQVINDNPKAIEDYKSGNDRAIKSILGQIMKISGGQVNPKLTNQLLLAKLKEL